MKTIYYIRIAILFTFAVNEVHVQKIIEKECGGEKYVITTFESENTVTIKGNNGINILDDYLKICNYISIDNDKWNEDIKKITKSIFSKEKINTLAKNSNAAFFTFSALI